MLISEFSRASGLPPDTIRFYVRRGLLSPEIGRRGGSNPYQIFMPEHLQMARLVKLAQSLGFTLREIAAMAAELNAEGMTRKRKIAILRERLGELDKKAAELARMTVYLRAKIAWMEGGERGPEPVLPGEAPVACVMEEIAPKPRKAKARRAPGEPGRARA